MGIKDNTAVPDQCDCSWMDHVPGMAGICCDLNIKSEIPYERSEAPSVESQFCRGGLFCISSSKLQIIQSGIE